MTIPRCCLNQFSGRPKRKYTDWETANYEAERLNVDKDTTQYNSYLCSHCESIHIGRAPKVIKFSHVASDRTTAALSIELGPRVIYGILQENNGADGEDRVKSMVKRWRRAVPPVPPTYPKRVLP